MIGVAAAAETPSPALLVLNKADQTLAIVDPASGKVVARVSVGEGPHEVTVSADGKFAYVGNYGQQTPGNTISVVDLPAQAELQRVQLGPLTLDVPAGKVRPLTVREVAQLKALTRNAPL